MNEGQLVEKAWGQEYILTQQSYHAGKYLKVKPDHQCSLHKHPVKGETWFVKSGNGLAQVGQDLKKLRVGAVINIPPGTFHRFINTGDEELVILEVSMQHTDDDVQRLTESGPIADWDVVVDLDQ
jgi:mannose-6-phosphate isomerase-like protein (cupin superfamily)